MGAAGDAQRRSESCKGERDVQRGGTTPWEMGALWQGGCGHLSKVKLNGERELPVLSLSTRAWGAPALWEPPSLHLWNQRLGFAGLFKLNFALVRSKALELQ